MLPTLVCITYVLKCISFVFAKIRLLQNYWCRLGSYSKRFPAIRLKIYWMRCTAHFRLIQQYTNWRYPTDKQHIYHVIFCTATRKNNISTNCYVAPVVLEQLTNNITQHDVVQQRYTTNHVICTGNSQQNSTENHMANVHVSCITFCDVTYKSSHHITQFNLCKLSMKQTRCSSGMMFAFCYESKRTIIQFTLSSIHFY